MTPPRFSHLSDDGTVRMVDVGDKPVTRRVARASALVRLSDEARRALVEQALPKGDALAAARIAGVLAAKQTSHLIPLTHSLSLSFVGIDFEVVAQGLRIEATVRCEGKTGVEIEAMTACAVAALTIYDMCKSVDKGIEIESVRLEEKSGGKSGDYRR